MNKKVSVIIPWFNTKNSLLRKAVNSVVNQSYKNLELIICNDGSDDKIFNQVRAMVDKLDFDIACVSHNNNRGLSSARNTGVAHCSGEWLVWLDADDLLFHDSVERLMNEASKGYIMTIGECHIIENNNMYIRRPGPHLRKYSQYFNTYLDPFLLNIFSIQPQIISRDAFLTVKGFSENFLFAELTDFFLKIVSRFGQERISFDSSARYQYNRNVHNSLSKNREELFRYRKKALLGYRDRQCIDVEDIIYLGMNSETGMQTYAPVKQGITFQTPYYRD